VIKRKRDRERERKRKRVCCMHGPAESAGVL
jgi:hypothetical protein